MTGIILNSGDYGEHRLSLLNLFPQTGAIKMDERFEMPEVAGQALVWMACPGRTG